MERASQHPLDTGQGGEGVHIRVALLELSKLANPRLQICSRFAKLPAMWKFAERMLRLLESGSDILQKLHRPGEFGQIWHGVRPRSEQTRQKRHKLVKSSNAYTSCEGWPGNPFEQSFQSACDNLSGGE